MLARVLLAKFSVSYQARLKDHHNSFATIAVRVLNRIANRSASNPAALAAFGVELSVSLLGQLCVQIARLAAAEGSFRNDLASPLWNNVFSFLEVRLALFQEFVLLLSAFANW